VRADCCGQPQACRRRTPWTPIPLRVAFLGRWESKTATALKAIAREERRSANVAEILLLDLEALAKRITRRLALQAERA
jgi:hypothetical protein